LRPSYPFLLAAALLFLGAGCGVSTQGRRETGSGPGRAAEPAAAGTDRQSIGAGPEEERITLRGMVRSVGSAPFQDIVISGENGDDWYIEGPEGKPLAPYQYRTVIVEGTAESRELFLADGAYIGVRKTLRNVTIIEIENDTHDNRVYENP
jgi:hypothetical protein